MIRSVYLTNHNDIYNDLIFLLYMIIHYLKKCPEVTYCMNSVSGERITETCRSCWTSRKCGDWARRMSTEIFADYSSHEAFLRLKQFLVTAITR